MMNDKIKILILILGGFVGGVVLILMSEFLKFSHLNLVPLGGCSWAVWIYPVLFALSYGTISKLLKVGNYKYVFVVTLILCAVILGLVFNNLLFTNIAPFGCAK